MPEENNVFNVKFEFGDNWNRFLLVLDDSRIIEAERTLKEALKISSLKGKTFLDAGSGSGLFSLVACRLGADRIVSFDYDLQSVGCTQELKKRYFPDAENWIIEQGSLLDEKYINALQAFDVVYSWGVLHHTGNMWQAIENLTPKINSKGMLYISIYNDQGRASDRWTRIKYLYNRLPKPLRFLVLIPCFIKLWGPAFALDFLRAQPFKSWREYGQRNRGMSLWHDVVDWVGGYPFEVAKPDEIVDFFCEKEFYLSKLVTVGGGHGCNQFVFSKK